MRSYHLDSFGHANHAVFLNWFEGARFDAFRDGGIPPRTIRERGWGIYVVRVEVDYLAEVRLDDLLLIRTRVESTRRTSMTLRQEALLEDGRGPTAADARVVAVWVGEDGRPMRVPEEARRALTGEEDPGPPPGALRPA